MPRGPWAALDTTLVFKEIKNGQSRAGKIIHDQIFLLRQVVPKATTVAMLVEPNRHDTEPERKDVQAAAQGRLVCNSSLSMSASAEKSVHRKQEFQAALRLTLGALRVRDPSNKVWVEALQLLGNPQLRGQF